MNHITRAQEINVAFKLLTLACLSGILVFPTCASSPADRDNLASAESGFAFLLLKQIAKEQPASTILISPYSASTVLQMVCNGARGRTRSEMQQVLGTTGLQSNALNWANKEVGESLSRKNTNVVLTTANAVWYRQGTPLKPDFATCNQQFFNATVAPLAFENPASTGIINDWAKEKTHGKIDHIADNLLSPLTELFLANAVYFKGKWDKPFDPKNTKDRIFHLRGGRNTRLPMMEQTGRFTYRRGTGYQAVRLVYQGWSLGMYVFLTDNGFTPEKLLGIMNGDNWRRITEPGFREREGTLILPRFRIHCGVDLKRPLRALGIKAAFDGAEFSGIAARSPFISEVRQQAFVEVNEEGTEAAAATALVAEKGIELDPPKPFQMIVDRPFLFLIEDKETKMILFMGVVFNPS